MKIRKEKKNILDVDSRLGSVFNQFLIRRFEKEKKKPPKSLHVKKKKISHSKNKTKYLLRT